MASRSFSLASPSCYQIIRNSLFPILHSLSVRSLVFGVILTFPLFVISDGLAFQVAGQEKENQDKSSQQGSQDGTTQKQAEQKKTKSLEEQWVDYLLAPITKKEREQIEGTFTKKEKTKLKVLKKKTKLDFDGPAALVMIRKLCEMGPRITGSKQMEVQILALKKYFKKLGLKPVEHSFQLRHPQGDQLRGPGNGNLVKVEGGDAVNVVNLVVPLHPKRKTRIILCCHYDSRPYADQDPTNPKAPLLGANDGASGVGFLMQLAPHLMKLKGKIGIDLVFFDAEEFVFDAQRDPLFIGSERFAKDYLIAVRSKKINYRYKAGVLVDMIADAHLELPKEVNSFQRATAITNGIWKKAKFLRVAEFQQRKGHEIRDDHLALINVGIPTCDIIDFDYPKANHHESYWHTTKDTVDKCSAVSMSKVAHVLYYWAKGYIEK